MRFARLGAMAMLVLAQQVSRAQSIPATVKDAELEGASFPRGAAPKAPSAVFADGSFGGSGERRCVRSVPDDSLPGGSLRSGEFIARAVFVGRWGLHAGKASKILWVPFHGRADGDTLLVRAARMTHQSDSLRRTIVGLARHGGDVGFPSSVVFPAPGQWLVVATAGDDWGCFILDVGD